MRSRIPIFPRYAAPAACFAALAFLAPASADAARTVRCGDVASGKVKLAHDCAGDIVLRGGRLDLAGRTMHGTVICDSDYCEVTSSVDGGTVRGGRISGTTGIRAAGGPGKGAAVIALTGVTVTGFGTGVAAGAVYMADSRIVGNEGAGVDVAHDIEAERSIVVSNGRNGLHARTGAVSVLESTVKDNGGSGVRSLTGVIVERSEIADNGLDGVENYSGLAKILASSIIANGRNGVRTDDSDCNPYDVLKLRGADVDGNGLSPECGESFPCADLVSCERPRVDKESTCGSSRWMLGGAGSGWRVCELD